MLFYLLSYILKKVLVAESCFRLKLELKMICFSSFDFENTYFLTNIFFQESEDANKTSEEEKK